MYGITWKHVYFNIFVLFIVDATSILKLVFPSVYCFCLDGYFRRCVVAIIANVVVVVAFIYLFIFVYLFIYLFICLFIYLLFFCRFDCYSYFCCCCCLVPFCLCLVTVVSNANIFNLDFIICTIFYCNWCI